MTVILMPTLITSLEILLSTGIKQGISPITINEDNNIIIILSLQYFTLTSGRIPCLMRSLETLGVPLT